jgi:hypothetical protein
MSVSTICWAAERQVSALRLRNRKFADSLLEEEGFEPSVPLKVLTVSPARVAGRRRRRPTDYRRFEEFASDSLLEGDGFEPSVPRPR